LEGDDFFCFASAVRAKGPGERDLRARDHGVDVKDFNKVIEGEPRRFSISLTAQFFPIPMSCGKSRSDGNGITSFKLMMAYAGAQVSTDDAPSLAMKTIAAKNGLAMVHGE
jgi:hypothetical protein